MKAQIEEMARNLENHTCMSQFQAEIASRTLYLLGYRKQEWISVEDRLPEREGQYLVYTILGDIRVCRFRTSTITDRLSFEYSCTHWMPLPEPPKMKGGAE